LTFPEWRPIEGENLDPGRFAVLTNERDSLQVTRAECSAHPRRDEVGAQRAGWLPALRCDTILEDTNCLMHPIRWKERR